MASPTKCIQRLLLQYILHSLNSSITRHEAAVVPNSAIDMRKRKEKKRKKPAQARGTLQCHALTKQPDTFSPRANRSRILLHSARDTQQKVAIFHPSSALADSF